MINIFNKIKTKKYRSMLFDENKDSIDTPYITIDKHATVLSCANKIAELISNMNIYLLENTENGDRKIKNTLSKVVDIEPNKFMTRKNLIHKIVMDLILTGNSVCTVKISKGEIIEINPLKANQISFREMDKGYIINKSGIIFKPDEVLHFVLNPSIDNPFVGAGYTDIIKSNVFNLVQEEATKKAFLKDKWKPSLIISTTSDSEEILNDESRRKLLDSYTNTTRVGEPWIVPADEIKIEKITPLSLKDLAIQESIEFDKKSLCRDLGVPCFMLGIGEFNENEYNNFISTTVSNIATAIQQELTKKLILNEKQYFKFNQKSLLYYNLKDKTLLIMNMVQNGLISRNEARNEFDYNYINDDGMDDILLLENYIPINKAKDQNKLLKGGDDNDTEI